MAGLCSHVVGRKLAQESNSLVISSHRPPCIFCADCIDMSKRVDHAGGMGLPSARHVLAR